MAPKLKKPLSAKAKKRLREAKAAAKAAAIERGEIPAVVPKKNDPFKKKILATLGDKTVAEATDDFKKRQQMAKAELQEAEAMQKAQQQQVDEAQREYEKAKAEIAESTAKEMAAAAAYKEIVQGRQNINKKVEEARKELYEVQKKVAMLEVLAVNHAKMKALDEARKKAQEAAEEARKNMLAQKQREKEALEATRKALADTRAEQRSNAAKISAALGKKRKADDDTVASTQADAQAADID